MPGLPERRPLYIRCSLVDQFRQILRSRASVRYIYDVVGDLNGFPRFHVVKRERRVGSVGFAEVQVVFLVAVATGEFTEAVLFGSTATAEPDQQSPTDDRSSICSAISDAIGL